VGGCTGTSKCGDRGGNGPRKSRSLLKTGEKNMKGKVGGRALRGAKLWREAKHSGVRFGERVKNEHSIKAALRKITRK